MQEDLSTAFTQQAGKIVEPIQKFQSLWATNLQAFSDFQMKTLEGYSKLGIAQVKNVIEIKDPQDYQAFSSAQSELIKIVNEKVIEDNKQITQMTQAFFGDLESLWKESVPSSGEAKETTKNSSNKKAA